MLASCGGPRGGQGAAELPLVCWSVWHDLVFQGFPPRIRHGSIGPPGDILAPPAGTVHIPHLVSAMRSGGWREQVSRRPGLTLQKVRGHRLGPETRPGGHLSQCTGSTLHASPWWPQCPHPSACSPALRSPTPTPRTIPPSSNGFPARQAQPQAVGGGCQPQVCAKAFAEFLHAWKFQFPLDH